MEKQTTQDKKVYCYSSRVCVVFHVSIVAISDVYEQAYHP